MLSAQEIEAQYQARLRKQMYEQQLAKFINPDRDISLEGVWVAYVWHAPDKEQPAIGEWILAGFRRRRNLRKTQTMNRFFSKIRRKLGIDKKAPVKLYDLSMAVRRAKDRDQTWRFRAPQFQARKQKMAQITPIIDRSKRKTRAKQRALIFNPKKTKYIALGRSGIWDKRKRGFGYLGPLQSEGKRQAQFEIKRLFPIFDDLLVVPVSELSKPLRAALIRNRRVRAGVTRIEWPEVPPSFDKMWDKFVRHLVKKEFDNAIDVDDPGLIDTKVALQAMWEEQKCPWLTMNWFRKQINSWSSDSCERIPRKTSAKRKATTNASRKKSSARRKNAKPGALPRSTRKSTPAKRSARSGRSVGRSATPSVLRVSTTLTNRGTSRRVKAVPQRKLVVMATAPLLNRLRIVAVLRHA